jgi:hypothetical protein
MEPGQCYFLIHKNTLPSPDENIYLIGDTFLRHFYSVFNFGANTVGLGVNIHSAKVAKIYNASSSFAYNTTKLI